MGKSAQYQGSSICKYKSGQAVTVSFVLEHNLQAMCVAFWRNHPHMLVNGALCVSWSVMYYPELSK